MSHEQVLRRLYEAFNDDDSDYLRSVVTDDVVVHVLPNELIPAATLRGREELVCTHEKNLSATNLRQQVESISVVWVIRDCVRRHDRDRRKRKPEKRPRRRSVPLRRRPHL